MPHAAPRTPSSNAQRNKNKVEELAASYGVPSLVFASSEAEAALQSEAAAGVGVVLNCAGPFVETFDHFAHACCKTGVHYLDVTGEIEVFLAAADMSATAKASGTILMPGVGFDIVATDCVAAALKADLPSATHLQLAFTSVGAGGPSKGTATTMVKALAAGQGAVVRREGELHTLPIAAHSQEVDFGHADAGVDEDLGSQGEASPRLRHLPKPVVVTRWGDAVTAFHTTGIKNIEVFLHLPQPAASIAWLLTSPQAACCCSALPLEAMLTPLMVPEGGPSASQLAAGRTLVWGCATDAGSGKRVQRRLHISPGYAFTAKAAVLACEYVVFRLPRRMVGAGARPRKGFLTPAAAFGADFATTADPTGVMFKAQESTDSR